MIGGGDLIEFDLVEELNIAYDIASKWLHGLELTNLEKADIKQKLEQLRTTKKPIDPDNYFSPGGEAAAWFLKDNYGYDMLGPEIKFLDELQDDEEDSNYPADRAKIFFQRKQDERHKP